ncbi:maltase 2 [Aplysia californica]|uniref:Maltase 2 n=1 Tax=Aplysia californica TaxID=6500 RepID=A0ABM1A6L7_APLCA|nr:maltase 2 [Aplysia californica]
MVVETYSAPNERNKIYKTGANPFNFDLTGGTSTGYRIRDKVLSEYVNLPTGAWPNFVIGNHDVARLTVKYGPQHVGIYNMLLLTLWGTPTCYYGDEIGLEPPTITWEQTVDPWGLNYGPTRYSEFSRDPQRTPMQWDSSSQAGFTTGNSTWLPIDPSYNRINVKTEQESAGQSNIKLYKQLAALRKNKAFQLGSFKPSARGRTRLPDLCIILAGRRIDPMTSHQLVVLMDPT